MFNRFLETVALILVLVSIAVDHPVRAKNLEPEPAQAPAGPAGPQAESTPTRLFGIIDLYGLRRLTAEELRKQLTFKVGDAAPSRDYSDSFFEASRQQL